MFDFSYYILHASGSAVGWGPLLTLHGGDTLPVGLNSPPRSYLKVCVCSSLGAVGWWRAAGVRLGWGPGRFSQKGSFSSQLGSKPLFWAVPGGFGKSDVWLRAWSVSAQRVRIQPRLIQNPVVLAMSGRFFKSDFFRDSGLRTI